MKILTFTDRESAEAILKSLDVCIQCKGVATVADLYYYINTPTYCMMYPESPDDTKMGWTTIDTAKLSRDLYHNTYRLMVPDPIALDKQSGPVEPVASTIILSEDYMIEYDLKDDGQAALTVKVKNGRNERVINVLFDDIAKLVYKILIIERGNK
jgi:hypothetical protein